MRDIKTRDRLARRHPGELTRTRPPSEQPGAREPRDCRHHIDGAEFAQRGELLAIEWCGQRLGGVREDLGDREDAEQVRSSYRLKTLSILSSLKIASG